MYIKEIKEWRKVRTDDVFLEKGINNSNKKIEKFFHEKITYGKNGLEGRMGVGTSQINVHTISAAALSYANYLIENKKRHAIKILVSHDNRRNGKLFSSIVSDVLSEKGIEVHSIENSASIPLPVASFLVGKIGLDGALVITSSKDAANISGIRILNISGESLSQQEYSILSAGMLSINPLKVKAKKSNSVIIPMSEVDKYISTISKSLTKINKKSKNMKVSVIYKSETNGKILFNVAKKNGIDVNGVESREYSFKKKVSERNEEIEGGSAFSCSLRQAKKMKSNLIFTTNLSGEKMGVVVKHKKRLKYLDADQMASLYLNYLLNVVYKNREIPVNSYIVSTFVSGDMPKKIATAKGVKVYELDRNNDSLDSLINSKGNENFLFSYDESYKFTTRNKSLIVNDPFQTFESFLRMADYYFDMGKDLYQVLKDMHSTFGFFRTAKFEKEINFEQQAMFVKGLKKVKKVGSKKVAEVIYKSNLFAKVIFADGSWMAASASNKGPMEINVQTLGGKSDELIDVIKFEKEVDNFIVDNTERFDDKNWSWKGFLKYSIFFAIIVGIMLFVFNIVYKSSKGTTNVPIWSVMQAMIHMVNPWIWLSLWVWIIFTKVLGGWMKKRMFVRMGLKVKLRHIIISQIMGSIIAFITPFAIGGDAIGYWYLRRKGVQRGPLVATLSAATIWGEAKFALQTIILVGIGWKLYADIFAGGGVQSHAALIWFFVGLVWSYFAAFMLILLTVSRRIQESIIRLSIKLLEWFPYKHFSDLDAKESSAQYEFFLIRSGMKKLFNKWWFVLEMAVYDLIPLFFSPFALAVGVNAGIVSPNVASGQYWSLIISTDIVGTANSMSITPGGSGTGEWLNTTINQHLFMGGSMSTLGYSAKTIASANDLTWKVLYAWPDLLISALVIFVAILTVRKKPLRFLRTAKQKIALSSSIGIITFGLVVTLIFML